MNVKPSDLILWTVLTVIVIVEVARHGLILIPIMLGIFVAIMIVLVALRLLDLVWDDWRKRRAQRR